MKSEQSLRYFLHNRNPSVKHQKIIQFVFDSNYRKLVSLTLKAKEDVFPINF